MMNKAENINHRLVWAWPSRTTKVRLVMGVCVSRVQIPNGISIGSAAVAGLMLEANRQTDRQRDRQTDIHTQTDRDTDRQEDRQRQADRDGLPSAGWGLLWLIYAPNLKFLTSLRRQTNTLA